MKNFCKFSIIVVCSLLLMGLSDSNVANKYGFGFLKTQLVTSQLLSQKLFAHLIEADITRDPLSDPQLPVIPTKVDWGEIPISNGQEPTFLAIGTSITAGYRDGGLYRQGQLTAFPNLVAHQMGLKEFNSNAFAVSEANGTGYLTLANTSGTPSYYFIKNASAIKSTDPTRFSKAKTSVGNLGIPFLNYSSVGAYPASTREQLLPNGISESESTRYIMRFLPENSENSQISFSTLIREKKSDICLLEWGFTDYLNFYLSGGSLTGQNLIMNGYYPTLDLLKHVGGKAILITIPDPLKLPYFHFIDAKAFLRNNSSSSVRNSLTGVEEPLTEHDIILPTANAISLSSKQKNSISLNPEDVLSVKEQNWGADNYNVLIRKWAQQNHNPLFDLDQLYTKIIESTYVTDDGYVVNPDFRSGNFFSRDGLHPSAVGQAVIANELIKLINVTYKSKIPLISITEFARSIEK